MEEFYQTYRPKSGKFQATDDKQAKSIVTVCTMMSGGVFYRGVAVCSPNDTPNPLLGRKWARRYAMHSVKGREDVPITDYRATRTILNTDCPFIYQSEINPYPTFQEVAFFLGKKNVLEIWGRLNLA